MGLIAFPLDFIKFSPCVPNVHEEEFEQIRFNPPELKPHSSGHRVSSDSRSIIRRQLEFLLDLEV